MEAKTGLFRPVDAREKVSDAVLTLKVVNENEQESERRVEGRENVERVENLIISRTQLISYRFDSRAR